MTTTDRTAAFYADAAAKINEGWFAPLNRPPLDDGRTGAFVGAVRIRFVPDDGTLYDVLLSRVSEDEIAVSILGGGCAVFAFDGLYLDPSYVQQKLLGARLAYAYAVAALIGRAHDAAAATLADYERNRDDMLDRLAGNTAVVIVVDEGD